MNSVVFPSKGSSVDALGAVQTQSSVPGAGAPQSREPLWAGEEVMPHHCGCLLCLTGSTGKASSEGFQLSDDRSTKSSEKF